MVESAISIPGRPNNGTKFREGLATQVEKEMHSIGSSSISVMNTSSYLTDRNRVGLGSFYLMIGAGSALSRIFP
jgi:hypothetical protein